MILRAIRAVAWGLLAAFAVHTAVYAEGRYVRVDGAPQQCAIAAVAAVELLAAYLVVRALDRILDLAGRKVRIEALPPLDR